MKENYKPQEVDLILTNDGSHSLFVPSLNETYHSTKGAYNESVYIYINQGLKQIASQSEINILEFGFGTGLNAILSIEYAKTEKNTLFNYTTIEKYPLDYKLIKQLNYNNFFPNLEDKFIQLHQSSWNQKIVIDSNFTFQKIHSDFLTIELPKNNFDIIFYDAFAPSKQAEVWDISYLQKAYDYLKCNAFLVSYCSSGAFKRNLKAIGFEVFNPPGPMGKKEITLAYKRV